MTEWHWTDDINKAAELLKISVRLEPACIGHELFVALARLIYELAWRLRRLEDKPR